MSSTHGKFFDKVRGTLCGMLTVSKGLIVRLLHGRVLLELRLMGLMLKMGANGVCIGYDIKMGFVNGFGWMCSELWKKLLSVLWMCDCARDGWKKKERVFKRSHVCL